MSLYPGMEMIGAKPGLYGLQLRIEATQDVRIGRLGVVIFPAGDYLYIGSARGPGGISARVSRHLRHAHDKRRFWHIDWLRQIADPTAILWSYTTASHECRWVACLEELSTRHPARFGASDCGCGGHLIRLRSTANLHDVLETSRAGLPSDVSGCSIARLPD
jgi:Uri superfamily endonuclease